MASETDRVMGLLDDFTERLVTKLTLDVTANLIETTPVDTGWARANWVPNLSRPFVEDLGSVTPSAQAAAGKRAQQQAAIGQFAAGGYRLEAGPVYVSNNVPYISILNDGSSAQAPSGFVQRAISKAVTRDILSIQTP